MSEAQEIITLVEFWNNDKKKKKKTTAKCDIDQKTKNLKGGMAVKCDDKPTSKNKYANA